MQLVGKTRLARAFGEGADRDVRRAAHASHAKRFRQRHPERRYFPFPRDLIHRAPERGLPEFRRTGDGVGKIPADPGGEVLGVLVGTVHGRERDHDAEWLFFRLGGIGGGLIVCGE
jgi:hypothetical protein